MIDTRDRIDKLLAKADSTTYPAERDLLLAKVAELRSKTPPPPPPPRDPPRTMAGTPDPEPRWNYVVVTGGSMNNGYVAGYSGISTAGTNTTTSNVVWSW